MRILLSLIVVLAAASFAMGQQEPAPTMDPIEQLRLTPEQRQAVRQIFADTRIERQTANRRLRETNLALDQAIDAEPADENLIEQRINDVATAHAAQLRMRIQTEIRIRRLLRPEQLATLRRLRLQLRDVVAPQRMNNPRRPAVQQGLRPRP
jgi:Spy/CpxP family protein refolding chaperone